MRRLIRLLILAAAPALPQCTTATVECTEWVGLDSGTARSLVYRSHPLRVADARLTRALVMVHGQGRNANDYFRTAMAGAFLAGALDNTLVVSPRFTSNEGACRDKLEAGEVNWPCSGDSWRSGGRARNDGDLTSYDFADRLLRLLAERGVFPNIKSVVVAGHSAGGQFVSRYAIANRVHESLGVPVTYVVSNPSSYAYLDPRRPGADGEVRAYAEGRNCTTYDRWPYGLNGRGGYAARLSDEDLKRQLAARPVVYLLGELDELPLAGFDASCPAMAQGGSRLARGRQYAAYVNSHYGASHKLVTIPLCGHNARCVFTADPALGVLFP